MEAIQIQTGATVYNLCTTVHGDYDHDWDDYIDFSEEKGILYDSHDYTYGMPEYRKGYHSITELPEDLAEKARTAIIDLLTKEERIYDVTYWIGGTQDSLMNLPCKVVRSRKFRGKATLVGIASKRDKYNREVYKAFIVGSDNLKYYVSPGCIKLDKDAVNKVISKMTLKELIEVLDECHFGHWNFYPYNRHMFAFPNYLRKYADKEGKPSIRALRWGWQVAAEKEAVG